MAQHRFHHGLGDGGGQASTGEVAPTSTYLVSVSVGKFDVNSLNPAKPKLTKPAEGSRNKPLPFYTAMLMVIGSSNSRSTPAEGIGLKLLRYSAGVTPV